MLDPAVLLDRDGVIVELAFDDRSGTNESPYKAEDVGLIEGATEALVALRRAGYRLVVVSNQPAAAKGNVTLADLHAVHARARELLGLAGVEIDAWRYCLHHPEGVVPHLSGPCLCRKPAPGLMLAASVELGLDLTRSWVVGDADVDIQAGAAGGCHTILIENPGSTHRRAGGARPSAVAPSLEAAAQLILANNLG